MEIKDIERLSTEKKFDTTINLDIGSEQGLCFLAQQKMVLVTLLDRGEFCPNDEPEILKGLLNLIDHIQDTLVDVNGLPNDVVFPFTGDKSVWNYIKDFAANTGKSLSDGQVEEIYDSLNHPDIEDALKNGREYWRKEIESQILDSDLI